MNYIRLGDATDRGGCVLTASATMVIDGRAVARVGDDVSCPVHNVSPNRIVEGDQTMMDDGLAIARHGHRATCGCRLISSLG